MPAEFSNYEKMKIAMAESFLKYDQAKMIQKFALNSDREYLYLSFVGHTYRIHRGSGAVQWSDDGFKSAHDANYDETMTIYDVLCYSKDGCHLAREFVNVNSLSAVRAGSMVRGNGIFQQTADAFNGRTSQLREACRALSGIELQNGDAAFGLNFFPFLPLILQFWEADEDFPASLQILVDRNILDYMHYETLMFALSHLFCRLKEEMPNDQK